MTNPLDHVAYLSQEIGPRPAGTEEEQRAALYITEQLQKDAGLSTVIEDFNGVSNSESSFVILSVVSALIAVASLFLSILVVPAIIVTIIAAVLMVLGRFGRPVLSGLLSRGVSQNVVAQYKPAYSDEGPGLRRRKVVLVAHYDSGKVRAERSGALAGLQPALGWASLGAMILLPLFLIVRYIGLIHADGALAIVLNIVAIIIAIVALIPAIFALLHKVAPYNDAANCNASGVAVLLEVASRIGRGRVSEAEIMGTGALPRIHGERAARDEGVVPEGAELVYETPTTVDDGEQGSAADRLAAAKAAVAALTGKPIDTRPVRDIADNLVQVKEQPIEAPTDDQIREMREETREALSGFAEGASSRLYGDGELAVETGEETAADPSDAAVAVDGVAGGVAAGASAAVEATTVAAPAAAASTSGLPAWYVSAQKKAKRADDAGSIHRSRYAEALDAVEAESARRAEEIAQTTESELSSQIRQLQEGIREVKAPTFARMAEEAASAAAADEAPEATEAIAAKASEVSADSVAAVDVSAAPAADDSTTAAQIASVEASTGGYGHPAVPSVAADGTSDAPAQESEVARASRAERRRTRDRSVAAGSAATAAVDTTAAPTASGAASLPLDAIPLFADGSASLDATIAGDPQLPDVGTVAPLVSEAGEGSKQRAPLADAAQSGSSSAKSLLSMLPSLSGSFDKIPEDPVFTTAAPAGGAKRRHDRAGMRTTLPSLSGSISRQAVAAGLDGAEPAPSVAPATVGSAGMTGAFAPVSEELLKDVNVDAEDIIIDDADDSVYEENFTETGAFAGPGYVDMPSSRIGGIFGRFKRRKDRKAGAARETSTQEWLDVDEDFDAREVGKARGSWESFRTDDPNATTAWHPDDVVDEELAADPDATTVWSPVQADQGEDAVAWDDWAPRQQTADSWNNDSWGNDGWGDSWDDEPAEEEEPRSRRRRSWHGGAFSRLRLRRGKGQEAEEVDDFGDEAYEQDAEDEEAMRVRDRVVRRPSRETPRVDRELEHIYRFRNPDISTEVWFVALGSELTCHSGMKAFIAEHEHELRGAVIVELEGLGAGTLSFIESEGTFKRRSVSSRMGRYLTKANKDSGMSVQKTSLPWSDSTAAYAMERGLQAMHLAGVDGTKPALASEANDVIDNVDEVKLAAASDYVIALLKNI